jgi:sugar phosphate isomerase/epimerase
MKREQIILSEQDKIIELLSQIADLSQESRETVKEAIEQRGIKNFFSTFNDLHLSHEENNRINALKDLIEMQELQNQMMEGGK